MFMQQRGAALPAMRSPLAYRAQEAGMLLRLHFLLGQQLHGQWGRFRDSLLHRDRVRGPSSSAASTTWRPAGTLPGAIVYATTAGPIL